MHFPGGGVSRTDLFFLIHGKPGTHYPVRFRLFDDVDRPRSCEKDGFIAIPPRMLDPERREAQIKRMREELDWNKTQLTLALGRGHYWPANETVLKTLSEGAARLIALDIEVDEASEFYACVTNAYAESSR